MDYKVIDNMIAYESTDKKAVELADRVNEAMKILTNLPAEDLEKVVELREALEQAKVQYKQLNGLKRYIKTSLSYSSYNYVMDVINEAAKYLASTQSPQ